MGTRSSHSEKNFRWKDFRAKCPTSPSAKPRHLKVAHSSRDPAPPLPKTANRAHDRRSCRFARLAREHKSDNRAGRAGTSASFGAKSWSSVSRVTQRTYLALREMVGVQETLRRVQGTNHPTKRHSWILLQSRS